MLSHIQDAYGDLGDVVATVTCCAFILQLLPCDDDDAASAAIVLSSRCTPSPEVSRLAEAIIIYSALVLLK